MSQADTRLIRTIHERCRVCYTCVRECPAKAIRISNGQAEVVSERCIGCGNCVKVCSQKAKQAIDSIGHVKELLASNQTVIAMLAPSFPAEFPGMDHRHLVGGLKELGFEYVTDVSFGADLVAERYRDLLEDDKEGRYIATTCPAVVGYVERYHPSIVKSLAPIVSPMVAMARVLRIAYGADVQIVFIGPCIAKKEEARSGQVLNEVNESLTFSEIRRMLDEKELYHRTVDPAEFDPPIGGIGGLFPLSRGLLQSANIEENLVSGDVVSADGRTTFTEAIKEFESGDLDARLLDILCCSGCIMGAGMTTTAPIFSRRSRISKFVQNKLARLDRRAWREDMMRFESLDLSRQFCENDQRISTLSENDLFAFMRHLGKENPSDELNCGACGYESCREHAIAIYRGLAENEMCLPYTIDRLKTLVGELEASYEKLNSAQQALVHSEKLANMGQLSAGVAHEINNPLGVVLMYSHILQEESEKHPEFRDEIAMIVEHASRSKNIVEKLLNFARQNKVKLESVNIIGMVKHHMVSMAPPEGIEVQIENDLSDPVAEIDRDQVIQVLTNLVSNAYGAMPVGGKVIVRTSGNETHVKLMVIDTGTGILKENISRVFTPFFTTKPQGKGTGLGLAVSYGIVKMHRGDIQVASNADPDNGPTGTTFTVTLPRRAQK
jgi:signal transduction histidine kinase/Fe-S-cluster-containing hydrogenase component 2